MAEHEKYLQKLALELRDICDEKGKETDPVKSASVIHQMGLLHKNQSPDKTALIKAVGLLNAALVRNPSDTFRIKSDLSDLCKHILKQANAKDQSVDLIETAHYIKTMITLMRQESNKALGKMKLMQDYCNISRQMDFYSSQRRKINSMQRLQSRITTQYKAIMRNLGQFCVSVMGNPPCKFAIAGMGSLARKEVTPYSDFEHIILLEIQENFEKNLEYFRWFSVIFHTIVLNLQETRIPSLNILFLNIKESTFGDWFFDTHTSGVSFDGMMPHACKFPLGRQQHTQRKPWKTELIRPVDKMLEYLSSEETLKNGYHLNDILTETCFVFGDQMVYKQFEQGVRQHKQSKSHEETLDTIRQQVKEDLDKFSTRFSLANLKENEKLNIKQLFYRTSTLFVSALGKAYQVNSPSGFDIIKSLYLESKISLNTKHNLLFAVAIACEIRIRIYMEKKSQFDYFTAGTDAEMFFDELFEIIDKSEIIRYLQVTYCLQREVSRLLNFKKRHTYSKAVFVNITICYALGLYELMSFVIEEIPFRYKYFLPENSDSSDLSSSDFSDFSNETMHKNDSTHFDKCLRLLKSQTDEAMNNLSLYQRVHPSTPYMNYFRELISMTALLQEKQQYEDALEFSTFFVELAKRAPSVLLAQLDHEETLDMKQCVCIGNIFIAKCSVELDRPDDALNAIHVAMQLQLEANGDSAFNIKYYLLAGDILLQGKHYDKALLPLQLSLGTALSLDIENDQTFNLTACVYSGLGSCLMQLGLFEEALHFLELSVKIIDQRFLSEELFSYHTLSKLTILSTYFNLGKCHLKLQNFQYALTVFLQTLELPILKNIPYADETSDDYNAETLAELYHEIAMCFIKLNRFVDARDYFQEAYTIRKIFCDDEQTAKSRMELLRCYMTLAFLRVVLQRCL